MVDETEDDLVLGVFRLYYRYLTVENADGDITYDGFQIYLDMARDELTRQLSLRSIAETDITVNEERIALCHIIADNFEMGNPDYSFRSQSQAPGVSFSRGEDTGPRLALNKLLDSIELAVKRSGGSGGRRITLTSIKDSTNYPKRYKRTDIPAWNTAEEGFDAEEVSDLGQSIYDNSTTSW